MARLRIAAQQGTITDNPLALGATTITSTGFASLPTITAGSGDILALTLDPGEVNGAAEVVWVTAHGAAATTVTVSRGQEQGLGGAAPRAHPSGTVWDHGPTAADFEANTAAAPAGPFVGQRWRDPGYTVARIWNGYEWVYAQENVRDRLEITSPFQVPITAVGDDGAVEVTGWTISPLCPPGSMKIAAKVTLDHGTAQQGWVTGRYMGAYLADATYATVAPIPIGDKVLSRSDLVGGLAAAGSTVMNYFRLEAEITVTPEEAGTRIYKLMAYISNAGLLNAQVYAHPDFKGWLKAEVAA